MAITAIDALNRIPQPERFVKLCKKGHPRLLMTDDDWQMLAKRIGNDDTAAGYAAILRAEADGLLAEEPSTYDIPDGVRLLMTSRRVVRRVYTLAIAWRLYEEEVYFERAWDELHAAAHFPDWNPKHFLDTAEMTHAIAIGYDWLYDDLTAEQREILRSAIIEKGLNVAMECYQKTAPEQLSYWTTWTHNWNQVCNGGIGMGALAILDEEPELAGKILNHGLKLLPSAMKRFAPDGGWDEGPGYWRYATEYNVLILAALRSALGTDFGLSDIEAFCEAGTFPMYTTGPTGRTFNYADGGDRPVRAPQMFWMARRYNRPEYAAYQQNVAAPEPLDLLWHYHVDERREPALDRHFRDIDVVTLRSGWDENAVFVGFKAGDNKANHSNLDLGSFVLDADGVRWAIDLGGDDYNLPDYWGATRWTYYRMRAEGHNTLVLAPGLEPDQDPKAAGSIVTYSSHKDDACAVADITDAYPGAASVYRGIKLIRDHRAVLIQDEIELREAGDIWWFMHTEAGIEINDEGDTAILRNEGHRLCAQLLMPEGAKFAVLNAAPLDCTPHPPKQAVNAGVQKLSVKLENSSETQIAVLLTPLAEDQDSLNYVPELKPLALW